MNTQGKGVKCLPFGLKVHSICVLRLVRGLCQSIFRVCFVCSGIYHFLFSITVFSTGPYKCGSWKSQTQKNPIPSFKAFLQNKNLTCRERQAEKYEKWFCCCFSYFHCMQQQAVFRTPWTSFYNASETRSLWNKMSRQAVCSNWHLAII